MTRLRNVIEYSAGLVRGAVALHRNDPPTPQSFRILGKPFRIPFPSFKAQYRTFFLSGDYDLHWPTPNPRILDLGANYGMSCLYFKHRFPQAQLVAFEPDPQIFQVLKQNLANRHLVDIELHNSAAWLRDGEASFTPDGLGGGALDARESSPARQILVRTMNLRAYLTHNHFDIIKMDIEGAEHELLPNITPLLPRTQALVFEYHSIKGRKQQLGSILKGLEDSAFRCYLKTEDKLRKPLRQQLSGGFDNRIVVYCRRAA